MSDLRSPELLGHLAYLAHGLPLVQPAGEGEAFIDTPAGRRTLPLNDLKRLRDTGLIERTSFDTVERYQLTDAGRALTHAQPHSLADTPGCTLLVPAHLLYPRGGSEERRLAVQLGTLTARALLTLTLELLTRRDSVPQLQSYRLQAPAATLLEPLPDTEAPAALLLPPGQSDALASGVSLSDPNLVLLPTHVFFLTALDNGDRITAHLTVHHLVRCIERHSTAEAVAGA